ncbi:MAG: hypothetical protein NC218_10330 [Acetobacter sp.]|nr:hypothetical protein [Acetobacter sp.]
MNTKKEINTKVENENIFRKHFIQFAMVGLCGMLAFRLFYITGWYEAAILIIFATPCNIPSYLMRIRKNGNSEDEKAITHIGILALVLVAAAIILALAYPIEGKLLDNTTKEYSFSFIWLTLKACAIQFLGIISGIFPKSPQN